MRVMLPFAKIAQLRDMLREEIDDDQALWLDTLQGETDVFEIVQHLLGENEEDAGIAVSLISQIQTRSDRLKRVNARIDRRKAVIIQAMKACGLTSIPLPEATVTLRTLPAKIAVNDDDAVPAGFRVETSKPSMELINSAFTAATPDLPNWLRVEDARPSLTVRRK